MDIFLNRRWTGWDASSSQFTPEHFVRFPWQFAGTHLYSWMERGTVRVKCLAQEHNTMARPGLEPGPLDPESSALTTRPPRFHCVFPSPETLTSFGKRRGREGVTWDGLASHPGEVTILLVASCYGHRCQATAIISHVTCTQISTLVFSSIPKLQFEKQ